MGQKLMTNSFKIKNRKVYFRNYLETSEAYVVLFEAVIYEYFLASYSNNLSSFRIGR